MRFANRSQAGEMLARRLLKYPWQRPIVLALPRGGVSVAYEVARALEAPLDVWVVRKVGTPEDPEVGLGAVAEGGVVYLNSALMKQLGVSRPSLESQVQLRAAEVSERVRLFRGNQAPPGLAGRDVVLVDDGIATGGTVQAALQALRAAQPGKVVLAVPVAAAQALARLESLVDDVVCLIATPDLHSVGAWYEDFDPVEDHEVICLLRRARRQ